MKKVLFVATVVKIHIAVFQIPYLKIFKEMGWTTAVAASNDYENPDDCVIPHCDVYYDIPFERNPFKPRNVKAYKELKKIIDEGEYDVIHCHTPVGAMLTRLAAGSARKKGTKIFYTAHGFHFYKGAPLIYWLLFYPLERLMARKTDVLITINKEDYARAKNFKAGKVVYVPGVGVDLKKFSKRIGDRDNKRAELGLNADDFVLLSVGKLSARNNHAVVLDALGELKAAGKLSGIHYVLCGYGDLDAKLKEKAQTLGISDHVHFLGHRNDVSEICNAADLFVSTSLQDDLPIALIEAMAGGLPVICSEVIDSKNLIENGDNGEIIDNTISGVADAVIKLKDNDFLRKKYAQSAGQTIKHFDLSSIEAEMRDIYTDEPAKTSLEENNFSALLCAIQCQKLKKEFGIPLDATVLLSVGEINKNKNHKVVIQALPELKNCWYVLCGRGPLRDELREMAKSLGVSDRFVMAGYRKDVVNFYTMADVFVFPSYREGLPVALMEAMAVGLPCIAARNRGTVDLLVNSEMLFEAGDVKALTELLQKTTYEDFVIEIENNRQHIQQFDIKNTLAMMRDLYEEVIGQCFYQG
ncbi:MAG: glycosyltransferase [Saccharofermentanales bacterium]|jgi:glycosyltransferase involved in cell wall biosynthesis